MNAKQYYLFLLVVGLVVSKAAMAQEKLYMDWSVIAQLPPDSGAREHPGVAGAFAGIHQGMLIVAGGANFPEAMPWNAGKKKYHDAIYVLAKTDDTRYDWMKTDGITLPFSIAYGASITTPNGIICVGGENEKGAVNNVWLLQWNQMDKHVDIKTLPALPVPLANASASYNEAIVYLAGGENAAGVSDRFYSIDLNAISKGWKALPTLPSPVSHAVSAVQFNGHHSAVYVIGGRQKKANGISNLFQSVYSFDIANNKWMEQSPLPYALSAGTGAAYGEHQIILFGGDKGATFHKTELLLADIAATTDTIKKEKLVLDKNNLQQSHPGFSNEVLVYNTIENTWKLMEQIPFPTPVTTTAIKCHDRFFIPSGEIKAGVRTPNILMGVINSKNK